MNYEGDLSPQKCWTLLKDEGAILIDVRTKEEWSYVGVPVVEKDMKPIVFQEWQKYPNMDVDPKYAENLENKINEIHGNQEGQSTPLCFLCRSGVRSKAAAAEMTKAGYQKCFNVTGGFEGQTNEHGHRGANDGWKFDNMPWMQK